MYLYHSHLSNLYAGQCMYMVVLSISILFQIVAQVAAIAHIMHIMPKMTIIAFVIIFSRLDSFCLEATELRIILVSGPV